jgi:deoxyribonuclease-4
MITIGGHVSAAGGLVKAIERGSNLGFSVIQIHPSPPQSWSKPKASAEDIVLFNDTLAKSTVKKVFFHNIYLTNFASTDQLIWDNCITATRSYLELGNKIHNQGTITHLGSHKGLGLAAVLPQLISGLRLALAEMSPESPFIIENTAGGGGTIGRTLEEINLITDQISNDYPEVKICIDTCHAFAAGIPIHTETGLNQFIEEFKRRFGLDRLACIHLNDSKHPFNSNKDRHENIGDGFIGNEAFARIFHHPDLQKVPFILEVPGIEGTGPDLINRMRVEKLAS